jgi:heat shock protein HslJ
LNKSIFWRFVLFYGLLTTILTSCAKQETPIKNKFENTGWVLESYGEPGNLQKLIPDTSITAEFISSEGTMKGNSGCNLYSGGYNADGTKLKIPGPIAVTEMYCEEPKGVMDQEKQYLEILQAAESYSIEDGRFKINCVNQVLIYISE